mmetsp:Transcript_30281/g.72053  ORF Transcript_30281/g.72053 Transcript_30281/m.72053 type:complete len:152 (+) Transcript_30281:147-602(+)
MLSYHHAQDVRFQTPTEPKNNSYPCPERPHAQHVLVHGSWSKCNQPQKRRLCLPYFPHLSQTELPLLDVHVQKTEGRSPKRCADELPTINLSPRRSTPEPPTAVGSPVPPSSMKTDTQEQKCSKRRRRTTLMDESMPQLRLERRSCFSRAA